MAAVVAAGALLAAPRGTAAALHVNRGVLQVFQVSVILDVDAEIEVDIVVNPGGDKTPINPNARGVLAVAILSSATFNAAAADPDSVCFGSAGHPDVRACSYAAGQQPKVEDVNGDGLLDLVLHFVIRETGIAHGDTHAVLTGRTLDGVLISGSDAIRTVPPLDSADDAEPKAPQMDHAKESEDAGPANEPDADPSHGHGAPLEGADSEEAEVERDDHDDDHRDDQSGNGPADGAGHDDDDWSDDNADADGSPPGEDGRPEDGPESSDESREGFHAEAVPSDD